MDRSGIHERIANSRQPCPVTSENIFLTVMTAGIPASHRMSLLETGKPAVIDRRYSGKLRAFDLANFQIYAKNRQANQDQRNREAFPAEEQLA